MLGKQRAMQKYPIEIERAKLFSAAVDVASIEMVFALLVTVAVCCILETKGD